MLLDANSEISEGFIFRLAALYISCLFFYPGLSSNRYPKHPSTAPGYDNYYGGQVSQIPQQPASMYTGQTNVYKFVSINLVTPV